MAMASDAENILDQFETALTDVLEASHSEDGASPQLRARLAKARANAYKARAGNSIAERDYLAAVDRAFTTARQRFR
jgi:hypothetical protein